MGYIMSAMSALYQGNAAAASAEYNATLQKQQAKVALNQSAAQSVQEARKSRQLVSAAEAGAMQDGLAISGSTNAVLNQARDTGNMNVLLAAYDGSLKAAGYRANARLLQAEAGFSRIAGYIGAGTELMKGVSSAYQMGV